MTCSNMKLLRNIFLLLCLPFSLSGQDAQMVIDSVIGQDQDALYIEHAGSDGVVVRSATFDGLQVDNSGGVWNRG